MPRFSSSASGPVLVRPAAAGCSSIRPIAGVLLALAGFVLVAAAHTAFGELVAADAPPPSFTADETWLHDPSLAVASTTLAQAWSPVAPPIRSGAAGSDPTLLPLRRTSLARLETGFGLAGDRVAGEGAAKSSPLPRVRFFGEGPGRKPAPPLASLDPRLILQFGGRQAAERARPEASMCVR